VVVYLDVGFFGTNELVAGFGLFELSEDGRSRGREILENDGSELEVRD